MKTLLLICNILLLLLPFAIQAQNRIEFRDTLNDYDKILKENIEEEVLTRLKSLDFEKTSIGLGLLEMNDILALSKEDQVLKSHSGCDCYRQNDTIFITNAIGFMAGIAHIVKINPNDSTYVSFIAFETDGVKQHKYLKDDKDFIANIEVQLEKSQLVITKDTKFSDWSYITGILNGISNSFYEQDTDSREGQTELKLKIKSIFRCRLKDFTKYIPTKKKN